MVETAIRSAGQQASLNPGLCTQPLLSIRPAAPAHRSSPSRRHLAANIRNMQRKGRRREKQAAPARGVPGTSQKEGSLGQFVWIMPLRHMAGRRGAGREGHVSPEALGGSGRPLWAQGM